MLWAVSTLAAAVYWVLSLGTSVSWTRSAIKGLAVAPLAFGQGAHVVALALALCSLGDVILSRPGERAFLGGLIAFALGHLAWIAVFVMVGLSVPDAFVGGVPGVLLVGWLILAGMMARVILPCAGALAGPVAAYILIIVAMGVTAVGTAISVLIGGAVLFAVSDVLLGLQAFVLTAGSRAERGANALIWPLYWGAIVLLTLGVLSSGQ